MKYVKVAIYSLITLFVAECSTAQKESKQQKVQRLVDQARKTHDLNELNNILTTIRREGPKYKNHITAVERSITLEKEQRAKEARRVREDEEEDAQLALHLSEHNIKGYEERANFTVAYQLRHTTPGRPQRNIGVEAIEWHPIQDQVATACKDGSIRLWNMQSQDCSQILKPHPLISCISWHPDGSQLASGASRPKSVFPQFNGLCIWNIPLGECRKLDERGGTNSVSWNLDGSQLASAGADILIWDTLTGGMAQRLTTLDKRTTRRGEKRSTNSVSWSPNGSHLASGSNDTLVRIWDPRTSKELQKLAAHTKYVRSVDWNPDGTQLVSAGNDNIICLWDIRTNKCLQKLAGHTNALRSVVWHPAENQLASGSHDKVIRIWDLDTLTSSFKCLQKLKGHTDVVTSIGWNSQGTQLASGSTDGTIKIWKKEGSFESDQEAKDSVETQERSRRPHEDEELQLAQALSASLGDQRSTQQDSSDTGTPIPDEESKHEREDERRVELQRERDDEERILERARQIAQDEIRRARERDIEEVRQSDYIVEEPDDEHNALVASQRGSARDNATLQQRLEAAQYAHQLALTQERDAEQRAIELRQAQAELNDQQQALRESRQIAASPAVPQLEHAPQDNGANLQQQLGEAEWEHRSAIVRAQNAHQHITELQQERGQLIQQLRTAQEERRNAGARLTIVEAELQRLIEHTRALQQTEECNQTLQASLTEAQQVIEELKSQLGQQKESEKKEDVNPGVSAGALVALQVRRDQPQSEEVQRETQRFMTLMQSVHDDAQARIDLIKGELERLRTDRDVRDRWIEHLTHQLYTSEQSARIQATLQTLLEEESSDDES